MERSKSYSSITRESWSSCSILTVLSTASDVLWTGLFVVTEVSSCDDKRFLDPFWYFCSLVDTLVTGCLLWEQFGSLWKKCNNYFDEKSNVDLIFSLGRMIVNTATME